MPHVVLAAQFSASGLPPELLWLLLLIVVVLLAGIALWVGGKLTAPPASTLESSSRPQARPALVPGKAFQKRWARYLQQNQGGGNLRGELVQAPDPFQGDAFLVENPPAASPTASTGALPSSEVSSRNAQTPTEPVRLGPPAPIALRTALQPPVAETTASRSGSAPQRAAQPPSAIPHSSPVLAAKIPPGAPPVETGVSRIREEASGTDEEASAAPPEETGEAVPGAWDPDRSWVILPSRFPLEPTTRTPSASRDEGPPADQAVLKREEPEVLTTLPSRFGLGAASNKPLAASPSSHPAAPRATTDLAVPAPEQPDRLERPPASPTVVAAAEASSPLTVLPPGSVSEGMSGVEQPLLKICGFGEAHLVVKGEVVPMHKATQELELALYLAHQAAGPQAQGKDLPFSYRVTIADALWPLQPEEKLQLRSLNTAKLNLNKRLQGADPQLSGELWLETGQGQKALRLRPAVQTDLVIFLRLAQRLAQTLSAETESASQALDVEALLEELQQCYQGGFALQFLDEEWLLKARARYRQQYLDALFDGARVLARRGRRRQGILLAKDLLLEEDVSASAILPTLLGWLEEEGGKADVASWREEYRRRYLYKFQRSLADDRPDQETLFRQALASD